MVEEITFIPFLQFYRISVKLVVVSCSCPVILTKPCLRNCIWTLYKVYPFLSFLLDDLWVFGISSPAVQKLKKSAFYKVQTHLLSNKVFFLYFLFVSSHYEFLFLAESTRKNQSYIVDGKLIPILHLFCACANYVYWTTSVKTSNRVCLSPF